MRAPPPSSQGTFIRLAGTLFLSALLSLAGLGAAFWLGDPGEVGAVLDVPAPALFLSAALVLVNFLCGALRLRVLAHISGASLSLWQSLRAYLLGRFSDLVTPGGSGQMPVMGFALIRGGLGASRAWALTLYTAILDLLFFGLTVPLALLLLSTSVEHFPAGSLLSALALSALFLSFWYLLAHRLAWLQYPLEKLFALPFLRRWRASVLTSFGKLTKATALVAQRPFAQSLLFALTAPLHLSNYAVFYVVAASLGAELDLLLTLATVLVASVASFVVPTPGGSGFTEFAVLSLFGLQTDATQITPALIVWRVLNYYVFFLIGPALGGTLLHQKRPDAASGADPEDASR